MDEPMADAQEIAQETPAEHVFRAPSVHTASILKGDSYSHFSPIPQIIADDMTTECVLGVDEAGRGPVIGPMVYALFYLPAAQHRSLLAETHHFDDSKVLTPGVRSSLMETLCTPSSDLHQASGWATRVMSARDISAGMLKAGGTYNLNAQAMDATIALVQEVLARGVNVAHIYVDTIGSPAVYQKRLERVFPSVRVTVAKKADSLYPCVSAASVCAKITRDAALDVCYETYAADASSAAADGWGSGYPSDVRCSSWLKRNMDPVFGWGAECRFSWGTAKDLLEDNKKAPLKVEWPVEDGDDGMQISKFFANADEDGDGDELSNWFGRRVTEEVF